MKKGFTLIELLVVVAITITLAAVLLPRLNVFKDTQDLDTEANRVLSAVKESQSNALSGSLCGDTFDPSAKAVDWYLQTNTNTYKVEPNCGSNPALPSSSNTFQNSVVLDKAYFDSGNRSTDPAEGVDTATLTQSVVSGAKVHFKNISGEVTFTNSSEAEILNVTRMIVVLISPITNTKTAVFIEKGGLVYIGAVR